jgi:glutaredoxin-related protein
MSHCPKCIKCGQMMQELQEDFDLSEIVEEDVNEQQPKK